MKELLVATQNSGKRREFRRLLAPFSDALRFPVDLDLSINVVEDGATYAENAHKKALAYARAVRSITLADDSGLEVDALGGAPGVRSARYAPGQDEDRIQVLLSHLRDVPPGQRTARFRCTIAIVSPDGQSYTVDGTCEGRILPAPAGEGGFGYDPVFYVPEVGCTMAQLTESQKNQISHRARAVQAALPILRVLLDRPAGPR